jgi:hypothetical protein
MRDGLIITSLALSVTGFSLSLLSLWWRHKANQHARLEASPPAPRPSAGEAAKLATLAYPSHHRLCAKQLHGNNACTCSTVQEA